MPPTYQQLHLPCTCIPKYGTHVSLNCHFAAGGPGRQARCAALVCFQMLVAGVLLPVVLACRATPLPPEEGEHRTAALHRSARLQHQRQRQGGGWALAGLSAARLRMASWTRSLDDVLRGACAGASSSLITLLAAWLLLSNSWVLSKALATGWPLQASG